MSLRQKRRTKESAVGNVTDVDMEEGIGGVGDVRATDVRATVTQRGGKEEESHLLILEWVQVAVAQRKPSTRQLRVC